MATIQMTITNRRCTAPPGLELVTHNPTDSIQFTFDAEWTGHPARTARFAWHDGSIDVPLAGDTVQVPEIQGTPRLLVGVYADGIASAPAKVACKPSIKAYGGEQQEPTQSQWDQVMEMINEGVPYWRQVEAEWHTPTLLNGWTELAHYPVRYCKDACGFVHFKGRVSNASPQNSGFILSISDNYRPPESQIYLTPVGSSSVHYARVNVSSWDTGLGLDGPSAIPANAQLNLCGIIYKGK